MALATEIAATQAANLKAYWKCDETSGTTLADSSGNSKTLTLGGTYTLAVAGAVGNAVYFNGVDGRATRTDSVLSSTIPSEYTVFMLVKGPRNQISGAGTVDRFFAIGSSTDNDPLCNLTTGPDTDVQMQVRDNGAVVNLLRGHACGFADTVWRVVTWRRKSGVWTLWSNGRIVDTVTGSQGTLTVDRTALACLARATNSLFAEVNIQHVAVWNLGLTDAEILHLHEETSLPLLTLGDPVFDFSLVERSNDLATGSMQGVGSDGTNYYGTADVTIRKYTRSGLTYTLVDSNDIAAETPAGKTQACGTNFFGSELWIGANDYAVAHASTKEGWVLRYDPSTLVRVESYDTVTNHWCEGGAWRNDAIEGDEFWAIYHDWPNASRYRFVTGTWTHIGNYLLPLKEHESFLDDFKGLYQGAAWFGDYLITVTHSTNTPTQIDVHFWSGSAFEAIQQTNSPTEDAGQGLCWESASAPASGAILLMGARDTGGLGQTVLRVQVDELATGGAGGGPILSGRVTSDGRIFGGSVLC